tara:strand:- start:22658 stop:22837 length:180 start_codon:yes stop_codon:yes gene_type:complete
VPDGKNLRFRALIGGLDPVFVQFPLRRVYFLCGRKGLEKQLSPAAMYTVEANDAIQSIP